MKQLVLIALSFLLLAPTAHTQTNYAGNWQGAIELPGMKLELSIHLQQENGDWKGFMSIPVQQIKDMALADLVIQGRDMRFKLPEVPGDASFTGVFDEKAEHLAGKFTQAGQTFPLNLIRASAAEKAAEEKRLSDAISALRHLVDSLREKRQTPGLAFGIIKDGKVLLNEGFGYRDLDKKLPVSSNTLFAIGSSSKAFTTAGLAILADQGKLDWEKPIVQYLPDFKLHDAFSTAEMTATDLTCHRSGLPRHDMMWYGSPYTRQQIYERLRYLQPNKSFRTTWQYNNLMFMTAGYLIERIAGKSWEAFTQENIFQPLGMTQSCFSVDKLSQSKDAALGYSTKDKKNTRMEYRNLDAIGPAGSINATSTDMLQWVKLHLNAGKVEGKQVVSAAEMAHLHTPQMLMDAAVMERNPEFKDISYALGWFTYRYRGLKVLEHGGNIDGFSALVYLVPEKDFGLVILTNQNAAGITSVLARYATDMVLGLEVTDWYTRVYTGEEEESAIKEPEKKPEPKRIAGTKPSHPLADYVGEFSHPGYGVVEVKVAGSALAVHYNSFDFPMEHWHYDVFQAQDTAMGVSLMLQFHSDNNGTIDELSAGLEASVEDQVFQKVPPARLSDPAVLKKMAGKYVMEIPGGNSCTLELRNTTLYLKIPGQPEYTLLPFQGNEFKLKDLSGFSVEFVMDEKGSATTAVFNQPNGVFKAKKAE